MKRSPASSPLIRYTDAYDCQLIEAMQRLHQVVVLGRWIATALLWLALGTISIWLLRHEWVMLTQHFTWAALRYGLAFNIWPTLGLSLCIGPTVGLLVWQTRNILFGLPEHEVKRLEKRVLKIQDQGPSHPLWRYVFSPS